MRRGLNRAERDRLVQMAFDYKRFHDAANIAMEVYTKARTPRVALALARCETWRGVLSDEVAKDRRRRIITRPRAATAGTSSPPSRAIFWT